MGHGNPSCQSCGSARHEGPCPQPKTQPKPKEDPFPWQEPKKK